MDIRKILQDPEVLRQFRMGRDEVVTPHAAWEKVDRLADPEPGAVDVTCYRNSVGGDGLLVEAYLYDKEVDDYRWQVIEAIGITPKTSADAWETEAYRWNPMPPVKHLRRLLEPYVAMDPPPMVVVWGENYAEWCVTIPCALMEVFRGFESPGFVYFIPEAYLDMAKVKEGIRIAREKDGYDPEYVEPLPGVRRVYRNVDGYDYNFTDYFNDRTPLDWAFKLFGGEYYEVMSIVYVEGLGLLIEAYD